MFSDAERLQKRIRSALDGGASLRRVERDVINDVPADEDRRSALWLYAWHYWQTERGMRGRSNAESWRPRDEPYAFAMADGWWRRR